MKGRENQTNTVPNNRPHIPITITFIFQPHRFPGGFSLPGGKRCTETTYAFTSIHPRSWPIHAQLVISVLLKHVRNAKLLTLSSFSPLATGLYNVKSGGTYIPSLACQGKKRKAGLTCGRYAEFQGSHKVGNVGNMNIVL